MYKKNFNSNFQASNKNIPRRNQYILASEVQLITNSGENLGVKTKQEALKIAEDAGEDLIEINPSAKPPICKVMNYSKYMYDKKKKKKKSKVKEQKELRFSPVIEQHDIDVRVSRAEKFVAKGHNVKLTIFRKGRQTLEQSQSVMKELLEIFSNYSTVEDRPKQEGRKLYITIKADDKKDKDKQIGEKKEDPKGDFIEKEKIDQILKKIKEKKSSKKD